MTTSTSANIGLTLPGATTNDARLGDMQAVKSALITTDAAIANIILSNANIGGNTGIDFSLKNLNIAGDITPVTNSLQNIGSPTKRFKAIYVDEAHLSINTLYLGDTAVLGTSADTVNIKADPGQSINIKTTGFGSTLLTSETGIIISSIGADNDVLIQASGVGGQVRFGANQSVELTAPNVNVHGNSTVSGNQTVVGGLTVTGNLVVNGAVTTVNSTTVTTADNIIEVNKGQVGSGVSAGKAGLSVDRGDAPAYQMVFDEIDDMFKVGMSGALETIASQNYVMTYASPTTHSHNAATSSVSGFMSASDKSKLDNLTNTTDASLITTGTLNVARLPILSWSLITSKPSTLGGYGITDALTTSFNTRSGAVTLLNTDVTTALGFIPLSGNQNVTYSGDVTGSGTTAVTLTLANVVAAGTGVKVTYNAKGLITGNSTLVATDIPTLDYSKITTGKPNTIAGYGITDALTTSFNTRSGAVTLLNTDVTTALGFIPLNTILLGSNNGIATLDAVGKVLTSQLPSYVDDVLEFTNFASFPITGEIGKIYIALDNNKTYRWSGSTYIYITSGAVDSVAGKTGIVTLLKNDVGLSNVDNTSDNNKPVSIAQSAAIVASQNASTPIAHTGSGGNAHSNVIANSTAGFMSGADKAKLDNITGNNTGDETNVTILGKLGLISISGNNTGDETSNSIKSKLGISFISGNNTGDQTLSSLGISNVQNKSSATIRSELTYSDVTTALGYVPASNSGSAISIIDTNTNAVAGGIYILTASLNLILPPNPLVNDTISISNCSGVNTCVLDPNGKLIKYLSGTQVLDQGNEVFKLAYTGALIGWVFIN